MKKKQLEVKVSYIHIKLLTIFLCNNRQKHLTRQYSQAFQPYHDHFLPSKGKSVFFLIFSEEFSHCQVYS